MSAEAEKERPVAERGEGLSPTTLQLLPKLLWFAFAVMVFGLTYQPVMDRLQSGEVAKVSFATFQIEFARAEFGKAAGQVGRTGKAPPQEFAFYADRIQRSAEKLAGAKALWVDDQNPVQNFAERRALTALGISFDLARSTDEAQELFDAADAMNSPYDFVITDIGRAAGVDPVLAQCFPFNDSFSDAGCKTAQVVKGRFAARPVPVIFYSGDSGRAGIPVGGFGATNTMDGLLSLVLDAVERRPPTDGQPFVKE